MLNRELLIPGEINDCIAQYARNACEAGLDGVVCSPLEGRTRQGGLRFRIHGGNPGIRYPDAAKDDQSRITSPADARRIGSDFIVVGRPITAAPDPWPPTAAARPTSAAETLNKTCEITKRYERKRNSQRPVEHQGRFPAP